MLEFKDTGLLKHPTVEKAYNLMRTFFQDGDDFAKEAIRPGEIISAAAKTPDPDAIAASILMNGMIVALEPDQFEMSVSPKAAEYLKKFYNLDLENPKFSSTGEQQVLLAQSMVGIESVQAKINSGIEHFLDYREVQQILDANERALNAIARKTTETDMLKTAQTQLVAAQTSLADIVAKREKSIAFENTGLPDHATVRSTYEGMKAWALDSDPLGGYAVTNAGIARVLVETGTTDPEVISAALLNQYSVIRKGFKKPSDFSPRIGELYEQTSPWADLGSKKSDTTPKDPEAQTISNAAITFFLEEQVEAYKTWSQDKNKFNTHQAVTILESIESLKTRVETGAALEQGAGLKTRMEKAVNEAANLMNTPENVNIRKPGSPKVDPGW